MRTFPKRPVPTSFAPGLRPSKVVEAELSSPGTLIVFSPKSSEYSPPSAERSSTRIEMNAGTRTTGGVILPFSPLNSASVRAGSSSPAPPGWLSGEPVPVPSPSLGSVSVWGSGVLVWVSWVEVVCSETVPSALVVVGSSSPPQPPRASRRSAKRPNLRKGGIDTIMEVHDREAMDTR